MSSDKMREEFEKWYSENFCNSASDEGGPDPEDVVLTLESERDFFARTGKYDFYTQWHWEAWQASREALVVDLPQQSGANLDWNQAIRYCHQAIEAAGVKVKV